MTMGPIRRTLSMNPDVDRMLIDHVARTLRERAAPDPAPVFLVPLNQVDWPAPGVIDLSRLRPLDPSAITGSAGQLSEATLRAVSAAVRTYLGPID